MRDIHKVDGAVVPVLRREAAGKDAQQKKGRDGGEDVTRNSLIVVGV